MLSKITSLMPSASSSPLEHPTLRTVEVFRFPQGSNIYKPETGTKVMKIALTGTGEWLDPSTLQLQFKLQNEEDKGLYVIGQPHSFIRRARLLCGGTVVEDIDQYNRVHEMLSILSGRHNRDMDDASSVPQRWDSEEFYLSLIHI